MITLVSIRTLAAVTENEIITEQVFLSLQRPLAFERVFHSRSFFDGTYSALAVCFSPTDVCSQ